MPETLAPTTKQLPEQQRRAAIWAEMNPPTQKKASEFDVLRAKKSRGDLLAVWKMGAIVKALVTETATFGPNAADQVARWLGRSLTELYELQTLATLYSEADILAISERAMSNGDRITVSHMRHLCKLKSAADRKKLLSRIFNESLSAGQTATEVTTGTYPLRTERHGGRKPSRPTSPVAAAQQALGTAQGMHNRMEIWDETLFASLDDLPPDKADAVLVKKYEDVETQWATLQGDLDARMPKLQKAIKHLKTLATKQAKAVAGDKAEAREEENRLEGKEKGRKTASAGSVVEASAVA